MIPTLVSSICCTYNINFSNNVSQILDAALSKNPQCRLLWEEKLLLNKSDEKKMLALLQEAGKKLTAEDMHALWSFMFDNIDSDNVVSIFTIVYCFTEIKYMC